MKNVMQPLMDSWYDLLNGNLTISGRQVNVYKEDAANNEKFHHVEIRAESETDNSNKATFVTQPVIVIDIITVFNTAVDTSIADSIDDQIRELVFPNRDSALNQPSGLQITVVKAAGSNYLKEDDGTRHYYRKITRFFHRITQTEL